MQLRGQPAHPGERPFTCTNKLISGQPFLDTYNALQPPEVYSTARDSDGHGTHTATTAAGSPVANATLFGIDRGSVTGIAPGAYLAIYKVCGATGCYPSDSAAAVAQAIRDGVDVINFSISGGSDPFHDPVELAFLDAYAAGVVVSASAGNSGPSAGTVDHRSPWVITVGASTQAREFNSVVTLQSGGDTLMLKGASIMPGRHDADRAGRRGARRRTTTRSACTRRRRASSSTRSSSASARPAGCSRAST